MRLCFDYSAVAKMLAIDGHISGWNWMVVNPVWSLIYRLRMLVHCGHSFTNACRYLSAPYSICLTYPRAVSLKHVAPLTRVLHCWPSCSGRKIPQPIFRSSWVSTVHSSNRHWNSKKISHHTPSLCHPKTWLCSQDLIRTQNMPSEALN